MWFWGLVAVATGDVDIVKKIIDTPVEDVVWVTPRLVYVLSEDGVPWRSEDGGRTWTDETLKIGEDGVVDAIHVSPANSKYIFFRGEQVDNWASTDQGVTYKISKLDLKDVRMHPTQPAWMLGSTMSAGCEQGAKGGRNKRVATPCYKQLYYTKDFGLTWTHALDYVVQFDWSPPIAGSPHDSDDLVYITALEFKVGDQRFGFWDKNIHFYSSRDYFKTSKKLVPHGNRFLFGDHSFLFVAAVNPVEESQVSLMISRDNETHLVFHEAVLPVELTEHSYTILDTSEGSVFLHVNHRPFSEGADFGHVYISDWSGLKYSLSLPYNHRSADGKCDFEKVEGLEGVYLANFVDQEEMERQGEDEEEALERTQTHTHKEVHKQIRVKTAITFDKGGEWNYLAAPSRDANEKPITCAAKTTKSGHAPCHLHLHGVTDLYGPFYSSGSAIGIIISTGTIGRYLQETSEINTYISRDAGLTWKEIAKGSHIYEIGDHGGLIVIAEDEEATDSIKYSWNEGLTWTELQISTEKFHIENIIIESTARGEEFLVYGWNGEDGVVVYLDFSKLHPTTCQGESSPSAPDSDYERWTPHDGRTDSNCLMGRTTTYVRRKADRPCLNPDEFERPVFVQNCICTREDFECDYGYETASVEGGDCLPMSTPPTHADISKDLGEVCVSTYRVTKGYRRVPGDSCVGGETWEGVERACPSQWVVVRHAGRAAFGVLAVLLAALAAAVLVARCRSSDRRAAGRSKTAASSRDDGREKPGWLSSICPNSWLDRFSAARYKLLGQDEGFYLNEEEFTQSAQLIHADDDLEVDGEGQRTAATRRDGRGGHDGSSGFSGLPTRTTAGQVPALPPKKNNQL